MEIWTWFAAILGLTLFEVVMSVDNAVINAQVLGTMRNERAKRFFLTWGILIAVFGVRGFLPWLILFAANPSLGFIGSATAMFSSDPQVAEAIHHTEPYLMMGGGMFLALLFLYWLCAEKKEYGIPRFESLAMKVGEVWFYAVAAVLLVGIIFAIRHMAEGHDSENLMLAAAIGSLGFFIAHGFKSNAERAEQDLVEGNSHLGDWAKVWFLEAIDVTFSIDSVVGAFAFSTDILLILIGNGIGALVVRQLTVGNVERVKRYRYLKNGAMYSVGVLATIMIAEGFHLNVPVWVSLISTFTFISVFLWLSIVKNRQDGESDPTGAGTAGVVSVHH